MIVKLLENIPLYGLKEGEIMNIPDTIALELISKGAAVKKSVDKEALNALKEAKERDQQAS